LGAIGRVPNTDKLNIPKVNLTLDKQGHIVTNEYSKTNIDHIYAIGDVTNNPKLTPVAIKLGRIFAENEFNVSHVNNKIKFDPINTPSVIFSHPPIGYVGTNYNDSCKL